ncbi:MAG: 4Fe-4S dicluster domain-containing protein [bacterium]|nr:4Fe-4S dicluster domain-containing protein [bacterium]
MKRVYPKEEACMACRLCEVACIVEHSQHKDIYKAYQEETPRQISKTVVEEQGPAVSISTQCRHCLEPACLEACITGAISRTDADSPVLVNPEKCIGCWMCVMACPYGSISRDFRKTNKNEPDRKVMSKCDLCPDRKIPACVEVCPNRALVFEER